MTEARLSGVENRMDRVEEVLAGAGDLLLQASNVAQQNASRMDRLEGLLEQTFEITQRNAQAIGNLTGRIDSLAAASERHDRILDFLLGQQTSGN